MHNMKTYSYVKDNWTESQDYDMALYHIVDTFTDNNLLFGYKLTQKGHKLFLKTDELTGEDLLLLKIKTGLVLVEDSECPMALGVRALEWLSFNDLCQTISIASREVAFSYD